MQNPQKWHKQNNLGKYPQKWHKQNNTNETTLKKRNTVIKLYLGNKSEREITRVVSNLRSTVNSIIKRFDITSTELKQSKIRQAIKSQRPIKKERFLQRKLQRTSKEILTFNYKHTVRNVLKTKLKKSGYQGRIARKTSLKTSGYQGRIAVKKSSLRSIKLSD